MNVDTLNKLLAGRLVVVSDLAVGGVRVELVHIEKVTQAGREFFFHTVEEGIYTGMHNNTRIDASRRSVLVLFEKDRHTTQRVFTVVNTDNSLRYAPYETSEAHAEWVAAEEE